MKSINSIELKALSNQLLSLKGAELQKITGDLSFLCLHFWKKGPFYLILSLIDKTPTFVLSSDRALLRDPLNRRIEEKPLVLFLKAHFLKESIKGIRVCEDHARVLEFTFNSQSDGVGASEKEQREKVLQIRLFSGGGNLGAFNGEKKVFLRKPQKLLKEEALNHTDDVVRSPQVIFDEGYSRIIEKLKAKNLVQSAKKDKNNLAQDKIKKALSLLDDNVYMDFAKSLESMTEDSFTKDVLAKESGNVFKDLYRSRLTYRENIEWAYAQVKVSSVKKQRLTDRLNALRVQEKDTNNLLSDKKSTLVKTSTAKKNTQLKKVHFHRFNSEIVFRCGKNADENLILLRSAKPWHMWMHLSDYSSGHLIIERPKNLKIKSSTLEKAAYFLFLKGAPKKLLQSTGQSFVVVFTECRYVKTQKGKKGLVTFTKQQSLSLNWESEFMHIF